MAKNAQARAWIITINHPEEHGLDRDRIAEILSQFKPAYYCISTEISTTGTRHIHIYIYAPSPIRFSTLKRRFPTAHIEKALGSAAENRSYIHKDGKWADDKKAETSIPGSFYEWGKLPTPGEEKNPNMHQVVQDVFEGLSTRDIILSKPAFAFKGKDIDILRDTLLLERYKTENRQVNVSYLYGETGTGKTRSIFEKHNPDDICRITNYGKNGVKFDAYHGQPVLVLEEFHSQIPIAEMLNILDVYPLMLPARYMDRIACYTTVYITSNVPLEAQYTDIQCSEPETWKAFLRRINTVKAFFSDGNVIEV